MKILLSLFLSLAVLYPGAVFSEPPEPTVTAYQDWMVICVEKDDGTVCTMRQTQDLKTEQVSGRLVRATVGTRPDGTAIMELMLPLGLDLRAGIAVKVDDKPEFGASFLTCTKDGCMVLLPLDEKLLASLKSGNVARVFSRPFGSEKAMVITISLMGFSRAYQEIQ
ncbi:MAG TPA: invasion associated locus B family protein [Deltaproteobacteria bacterium]|nr:invasion associated locus B family protein [Deltaproteobacteria bacterium]